MISLVVPIFNEEDNLPEFQQRAQTALQSTGEPWEIVFVNDGSSDSSATLLRQFHATEPRIKLLELSRNFGHQPAITAGIHHAKGDCVIVIDGDLQDPPEVIPAFVAEWKKGSFVVIGERRSRAEHGMRRLGFKFFYSAMHRLTRLPGPDAGIFGLMDRAVVDEFNKLPERSRFIPGLRTWLGFRQTSVLYDRAVRAHGQPKQTLHRLIHYAMDGMISFSYKPLRVATWMGLIMAGMTFTAAIVYTAAYFFQTVPPPRGFTTTLLAILFLGSVQLICAGILGEYIGRIYEEVKQRPLYIIQAKLGLEDKK